MHCSARAPRRHRTSRRFTTRLLGLLAAATPALLVPGLLVVAAPAPLVAQAGLHDDFDQLLRAHVRDGLVDYEAFKRSPVFARYLERLAATEPSALPRTEQLALWINAYNAYTIAQINAHGERTSIKNINKSLGLLSTGGAWRERMATVGGRRYTLDEIEHERIRPVFREPRVHFALVCAAISCPPLRSEAYTAERLDAQFDDQARRFLRQSPGKNRVDLTTNTVFLSRIFDWYGKDFAPDRAGLLRWLARYWPEGAERALLDGGQARIQWTDYDWSLNIQRK
ncbi:MAG TPA: DUF547 domain-containing protein [Gemmatimonadaceae bacterium]|nr:DUF547 domain-containing protein [Gemmatimonadaceae bacterium]